MDRTPAARPDPISTTVTEARRVPETGGIGPLALTWLFPRSLMDGGATTSLQCEDPGLVLLVDGRKIDRPVAASGVPVEVGSHRILLRGSGRRFPTHMIEVSEGMHVQVIPCRRTNRGG